MTDIGAIVTLINSRFADQNKYLDTRFTSIDDEVAEVKERVTSVEIQTKATNGRVTALEQVNVTEDAVDAALAQVKETNEIEKEKEAKRKERFWNNWSGRTQVIAVVVTVGLLLLGYLITIVDLWTHHR
jgi:hypothetical protein